MYFQKVDKKVRAADVKIRMFQVNGNEVSNVIEEESEEILEEEQAEAEN